MALKVRWLFSDCHPLPTPVLHYLCVCVHVRHTFCQLAYRSDPSTVFTVDSLKDLDLRKDVPFGGLDDE